MSLTQKKVLHALAHTTIASEQLDILQQAREQEPILLHFWDALALLISVKCTLENLERNFTDMDFTEVYMIMKQDPGLLLFDPAPQTEILTPMQILKNDLYSFLAETITRKESSPSSHYYKKAQYAFNVLQAMLCKEKPLAELLKEYQQAQSQTQYISAFSFLKQKFTRVNEPSFKGEPSSKKHK